MKTENLNVKILLYSELKDISIKQLLNMLEQYNGIFILYPTVGEFMGHWTILFKYPDGVFPEGEKRLCFFDPYGKLGKKLMMPDSELEWNKSGIKYPPYLTYLLLKCPWQMEFNEEPLQKLTKKNDENNIATCGRWCCIRLICRQLKEQKFADYIRFYSKQMEISPDQFVTQFTDELM